MTLFVLQVCFIASKRSMTIKSDKIWFPPKVFFYLKKRSKRKKWQECRVFSSKGIIDICKGSGNMEGQFSKFDMKELIIHQKVTSIAGLVKMWLIVHSQKKKEKKKKMWLFIGCRWSKNRHIRVVKKRVGIRCFILR